MKSYEKISIIASFYDPQSSDSDFPPFGDFLSIDADFRLI